MNQKRHIELSVYTRGGYQSSVLRPLEIVKHAYKNGSTAVAVTDFDSVWSYYDFASALRHIDDIAEGPKHEFKVIYGVRIRHVIHGSQHMEVTLLVKNRKGLQNLYRILSACRYPDMREEEPSDMTKWKEIPYFGVVVTMQTILENHEGLLLGRDIDSNLVRKVRDMDEDDLIREVAWYIQMFDYAELRAESFLKEGSKEEYDSVTAKRIAGVLRFAGKNPVAVNDVAAITPEDELCGEILNWGEAKVGYLQSTEEVLKKFSFFEDWTESVVIGNSNRIASMIEPLDLLNEPEEVVFAIADSEKKMRERCAAAATEYYGNPLPEKVGERLRNELALIEKGNSFGVFSYVTDIVDKCHEEGWQTIFRGCVANSLVAHLLGWTNTNPLPPDEDNLWLGQNLPHEFFLGGTLPESPHIEISVSPEARGKLISFLTEQADGEVYTIGFPETESECRWNERTDNYIRQKKIEIADDSRRVVKEKLYAVNHFNVCCHPGAILLVPKGHDITEYAPVMRLDRDMSMTILPKQMLPFDYICLLPDDRLSASQKEIERELSEEYPGCPSWVLLQDDIVASYLSEEDLRRICKGEIYSEDVTETIKPKTAEALVQVLGLIHGTGLWKKNVKELLQNGHTLSDVIVFREDVMHKLMSYGIPRSDAFKIAEIVRRGRASYPGFTGEQEQLMKEHNIPEWLIESMKKVKYLFPKGHELEYVRTALINLWYQKHMRGKSTRCHDT